MTDNKDESYSGRLYNLTNPEKAILKYLSLRPSIKLTIKTLVDACDVSRGTVKTHLEALNQDVIQGFSVHLSEESQRGIKLWILNVTLGTTDDSDAEEFQEFLIRIPQVSEILRVSATDKDYLIRLSTGSEVQSKEVRKKINGHKHVKEARTITVDEVVATPHTELSFLFDD